jgi:Mg2+ and Co2+ transporter CorA
MGVQYLVRAEESLVKLERIHVNSNHDLIKLPLDMKDLKENLGAVKEHSGQIWALNKHTIEMVHLSMKYVELTWQIYHHMTMKKADFAERSNKNMEFLAMCATIFLPLTLVTVNICQRITLMRRAYSGCIFINGSPTSHM